MVYRPGVVGPPPEPCNFPTVAGITHSTAIRPSSSTAASRVISAAPGSWLSTSRSNVNINDLNCGSLQAFPVMTTRVPIGPLLGQTNSDRGTGDAQADGISNGGVVATVGVGVAAAELAAVVDGEDCATVRGGSSPQAVATNTTTKPSGTNARLPRRRREAAMPADQDLGRDVTGPPPVLRASGAVKGRTRIPVYAR